MNELKEQNIDPDEINNILNVSFLFSLYFIKVYK